MIQYKIYRARMNLIMSRDELKLGVLMGLVLKVLDA